MWNPTNQINLAEDYKQLKSKLKKIGDTIDRRWRKVFDWRKVLTISITLIIFITATVALITLPWITIITENPGTVLSIIFSILGFVLTVGLLCLQASNTRKQIAAEQFKNAIEHLGSDRQAVALGGVHALHNLAVTFPNEYSKQVFEVLCSFIREETRKDEYQQRASENPSIVIQTIVDKLFREKESRKFYQEYKANLSKAFLRGVCFRETSLQRASFFDADLRKCDFVEAELHGADLSEANIVEAHFHRAKLHGTILDMVKLQEKGHLEKKTLFVGAEIRGVQCYGGYIAITDAIKNRKNLTTTLSGIIIYDDYGNEIAEEKKKEWFHKRGAKVDDLSAVEVQEIFKGLKEVWNIEES